jgi:hypothetical protein
VVCWESGEAVPGAKKTTTVWDVVEWNETKGYASDQYIDTGQDLGHVILACTLRHD